MSDTCTQLTHSVSALKVCLLYSTVFNYLNLIILLQLDSQPPQDEIGRNLIPSVARPLQEPSATRLARLPPLPEGAAHSERYYFLGWHVTPAQLTGFAVNNNFPCVFTYPTSFDGIRYISWKSGYKYAYSASGLVENGEHFEGQFPGRGKDTVIDIIMVYVNKRAYAHRRPTEVQLEKLIQIFGSKPRWFKDGKCARDFDDYEMWQPIR
jgi:hypothetical protein